MVGTALPAPADTRCELRLLASVDMLDNGSGSILIPVTIDGRDTAMIVDTGAFWSGLASSAVPDLKPYASPLGARRGRTSGAKMLAAAARRMKGAFR